MIVFCTFYRWFFFESGVLVPASQWDFNNKQTLNNYYNFLPTFDEIVRYIGTELRILPYYISKCVFLNSNNFQYKCNNKYLLITQLYVI